MRVRVLLEMVKNIAIYTSSEQLNNMSEYKIEDMAVKVHGYSVPNGIKCYEDYVLSTFKFGTFVGLWHFFAAANCLKTSIRSIYPNVSSPFINRNLFNQFLCTYHLLHDNSPWADLQGIVFHDKQKTNSPWVKGIKCMTNSPSPGGV